MLHDPRTELRRDPATIGIIGLALSAGGSAANVIQSNDARSEAKGIADKQAANEQALIDKATNQAAEDEKAKQGTINNASVSAAVRALRGKSTGRAGTILTGDQGTAQQTPGRTLLGG